MPYLQQDTYLSIFIKISCLLYSIVSSHILLTGSFSDRGYPNYLEGGSSSPNSYLPAQPEHTNCFFTCLLEIQLRNPTDNRADTYPPLVGKVQLWFSGTGVAPALQTHTPIMDARSSLVFQIKGAIEAVMKSKGITFQQ